MTTELTPRQVYLKSYYEQNKQKFQANQQKFKQENPDKLREYAKKYIRVNRDKHIESCRSFYENNKEYYAQRLAQAKLDIIKCDVCKCDIQRNSYTSHTKSKKHILNSSIKHDGPSDIEGNDEETQPIVQEDIQPL